MNEIKLLVKTLDVINDTKMYHKNSSYLSSEIMDKHPGDYLGVLKCDTSLLFL